MTQEDTITIDIPEILQDNEQLYTSTDKVKLNKKEIFDDTESSAT